MKHRRYPPAQEQTFVGHLIELRSRLLRIVVSVLAIFLVLMPFANPLYTWLAQPLINAMPSGTTMIATDVISPFMAPFKLALMAALVLAMPVVLYHVWAFIAPGLYQHERRLVLPLLISSTVLFYAGMAFAYFVVFPLMFKFMITTAPKGVAMMTDINSYLDFVLTMFIAFGAAFEVPIATILLVWMGMLTPEDLKKKRSYVIVGVFIVAAILTPPDVISQTLLALPMWMLFEAGLYFSRYFVTPEPQDAAQVEDK